MSSVRVSVQAALSSAEHLRGLLDGGEDPQDRCWTLWEAHMLQHWAQALHHEHTGYPALADALTDFATRIQNHTHTCAC